MATRDTARDKRIIACYQKKENGKYLLSVGDIAMVEEISKVRVYDVLKRNGIPTRTQKGVRVEFVTELNKLLEMTSEALLSGKNVRSVRQVNGWEVSIS